MATPITGGTAFDFGAAARVTAPPTAPVQQTTRSQPTADTVKLSDGAQVRLLKTQGQTVSQIAVNTALTTEKVNSYLGITQAPTPTVAESKK